MDVIKRIIGYKCPECRRLMVNKYEDIVEHNRIVQKDVWFCNKCDKRFIIECFLGKWLN